MESKCFNSEPHRKIQCNWSDTIEGKGTVYCQEMETLKDLDNVNNRYFCELHMKKVRQIRDVMFLNYVRSALKITKDPDKKKVLNEILTWVKLDI